LEKLNPGQIAETLAVSYLTQSGLTVITRNYACRLGEIDLILKESSNTTDVLVFAEVRYRKQARYGGAAASITTAKRFRLIRTAQRFIQDYPRYAHWPCRFDVVALSGELVQPDIRWIQQAFDV